MSSKLPWVGGDPNPSSQFGRDNQFNMMRWATEENDKLLAAINSDAAFEDAARKKAYDDWQKYVIDEAPVIPTSTVTHSCQSTTGLRTLILP